MTQLVLESLSELCRLPSFAVDMYVNYDCDMHCENVYESLCKFFYKHAFPSSGALHTIHLLALDCLLSLLANVQPRVTLSNNCFIRSDDEVCVFAQYSHHPRLYRVPCHRRRHCVTWHVPKQCCALALLNSTRIRRLACNIS